jgi:hypothetical protein
MRVGKRSFTALAFPPTCIHLSCNQLQLESNSVDLCTRAVCHLPADTRRQASLASPHLSFALGCCKRPGNIHQSLPPFPPLYPVLESFVLHLFQRVLITSADPKGGRILRQASSDLAFPLRMVTVSLGNCWAGRSICNKANAATFPTLTLTLKYVRKEWS